MRRLLTLLLTLGVVVIAPHQVEAVPVEAPAPTVHNAYCNTGFLTIGGVPRGGQTTCKNVNRWRVKVGCSFSRLGPVTTQVHGDWKWYNGVGGLISSRYCPFTARYALWVSREVLGHPGFSSNTDLVAFNVSGA
jgi:hypothetical protein